MPDRTNTNRSAMARAFARAVLSRVQTVSTHKASVQLIADRALVDEHRAGCRLATCRRDMLLPTLLVPRAISPERSHAKVGLRSIPRLDRCTSSDVARSSQSRWGNATTRNCSVACQRCPSFAKISRIGLRLPRANPFCAVSSDERESNLSNHSDASLTSGLCDNIQGCSGEHTHLLSSFGPKRRRGGGPFSNRPRFLKRKS